METQLRQHSPSEGHRGGGAPEPDEAPMLWEVRRTPQVVHVTATNLATGVVYDCHSQPVSVEDQLVLDWVSSEAEPGDLIRYVGCGTTLCAILARGVLA